MPKVTIVMPMYNSANDIRAALDSILAQTFADWELLVVDDMSTDNSADIVRSYAARDKRIVLLANDTGTGGPGPARNIGIERATGEYVAMMDSDDISLPVRLERQVAFMDAHPSLAMSSCNTRTYGLVEEERNCPASPYMVRTLLGLQYVFHCPAIILRRKRIRQRYPSLAYGEDQMFCINIAFAYPTANIHEVLYLYHIHDKSVTHRVNRIHHQCTVFMELLTLCLGFAPTQQQVRLHIQWLEGGKLSLRPLVSWLSRVITHGNYRWHQRVVLTFYFAYRILRQYKRYY